MPSELEVILARGHCVPGIWRDGCATCSAECGTVLPSWLVGWGQSARPARESGVWSIGVERAARELPPDDPMKPWEF